MCSYMASTFLGLFVYTLAYVSIIHHDSNFGPSKTLVRKARRARHLVLRGVFKSEDASMCEYLVLLSLHIISLLFTYKLDKHIANKYTRFF